MKIKLSRKLLITFLLLSFAVIFTTGLMSNLIVDREFNKYLQENNKININKLVGIIRNSYSNLDTNEIQNTAESEKFYVEIEDISGKTVYTTGKQYLQDKRYHMNMMKGRMPGNSFNSGDYIEESYDIENNGTKVGKITVGYFGIYNFSEKDVIFKKALYKSFMISMGIAIIIAVIISIVISKQLTKPLSIINKKSLEIRKGNFKEREDIKTSTLEIKELSDSINYLAESLDKQDALRKRLTSDMAHEIRTPLTILQNSMEAMMDGVISMDREKIESCYEEVIRINKLVDNLKNIASLEESSLNLNKTKFDIKEELERVCRDFQPYFKKKNIIFINEIKESRQVLLDKDKFRQIINNILSNAYRYSNENGEVQLTEEINDNNIIIKVSDNGIGISEEELPLIFERFYRSDKSRDRETGGAGIGLTITKALVEAHGGRIEAESKPNQGSCFTVILPLE
ncbi:MAG: HAMP domain-containing histidine kinase [Bacillota bacterium]|nr:HAMP domain-containing histidine kinase [Bacillota bacterium]